MEKIVVPQFVADWYDSAFEQSSRLSRILSSFANEVIKDDELFSWAKTYMYKGKHDNETSNVEEVIAKMYIYGFDVEVEEEKKYYWRKRDSLLEFETVSFTYLNRGRITGSLFIGDSLQTEHCQTKFTETEVRELVSEEDFNKLERVEIDE